jgi:hypothetical protein
MCLSITGFPTIVRDVYRINKKGDVIKRRSFYFNEHCCTCSVSGYFIKYVNYTQVIPALPSRGSYMYHIFTYVKINTCR